MLPSKCGKKKEENKLFCFLKFIYQEMECIYLPFGDLELFACAFVVAKKAWEKNKVFELEEFILKRMLFILMILALKGILHLFKCSYHLTLKASE